jgi:O-antigen ligase
MINYLRFKRLDYCAVLLGLLLSLGCMMRGLVDDDILALTMFFTAPLLWLSLSTPYKAHAFFTKITLGGILLFATFALLQLGLADNLDFSAWKTSFGRMIFIAMIAIIALKIGSSASATWLFMSSLILFGIIFVSYSLVHYQSQANPIPYYYTQGMVNPNHSADYLGILLIITLIKFYQILRDCLKWGSRLLPERLNNLNWYELIQLPFILYGSLLYIAGLFLTGSRGGIILSLGISTLLIFLLIVKHQHERSFRAKLLTVSIAIFVFCLFITVIFYQHGAAFWQEMLIQGLDSDHRPALFGSVIQMIADAPLLGHGLGGFASGFPAYRGEGLPVEGVYDKAHNSYLELAAEMGIIVTVILLLAAASFLRQLWHGMWQRSKRFSLPLIGLMSLLLVSLHSLIDFPLQIPALQALVIAIVIICSVQADRDFAVHRRK